MKPFYNYGREMLSYLKGACTIMTDWPFSYSQEQEAVRVDVRQGRTVLLIKI